MASGCLLTVFITYFTSEKKDQKITFLWVYRGTESHLASVVACTHEQAQANKFRAAVHLKATSVANNKSFWILLIAPLNFSHLCHKVFFRNHKPLFWRFFRLTTHGKFMFLSHGKEQQKFWKSYWFEMTWEVWLNYSFKEHPFSQWTLYKRIVKAKEMKANEEST